MRRLLAATVRKDGYEVTEARTGAELQDLLADLLRRPASRPPFDLIISDHRMPGLTGLEVLKGMQDESWLTPFIMITAFGSRQFEENARRAGAAAVFNKPFDIDDLRSAILNLIGRPQP
ncbi:MAG: response regulator [Deltaproteobacteria bacterium]|nr:response regulator [Deltaproteobacteria bacterium]